ncbi:protein of unknown function DUF205 [Allomeiothermus silvanus DSM 9946]|uniref:Glycerol-3-phosphate acyltransferase n=1 Tax=Allomeiothermus silvanus (strain ATCC 700542 / DSM 9946 / NBRC 106475 / NCIMB 13440 / VI-R2) TaxID=526227 RepID=D7BCS6_ALLS1|nr:glycerol-3-phosphate 1-O-acyltransferase PlsY [Allomeiothermus silvanus]ADH64659.1 protein of unknown function DUF205 [Allomeiothermus silvanus DSM 9946]
MTWEIALILLLAYLFGSIPVGALVARARGIDIQKVGSGNIGATNVLRTLGPGPAAIVAFFDVFKGGIALLISRLAGLDGMVAGLVAVAAVLGHNYSIWLRFSGGKGVATSFGTLLVLDPWVALLTLPIGVTTMVLTRYVSAGSMIGGVASVVIAIGLGRPVWEVITLGLLAGLIFLTHRENIRRLQAGTERRLGEKSAEKTGAAG